MFNKRNIKLCFERLYFHLKNLYINFYIPIIIADIFLPLLCFLIYKNESLRPQFTMYLMQLAYIIIPICSVWWVIFINKDYVEGAGNELLYVCKNKTKIIDTFLAYLLFLISEMVQFVFYIKVDNGLFAFMVRLICISFFYFTIVEFLSALTKSIPITIFAVLLYTVSNPILSLIVNISGFPLYYDLFLEDQTLLSSSVIFVIFGVLFIISTVILNIRNTKYN